MALNTAVDFRSRLRFPRAVDEPPEASLEVDLTVQLQGLEAHVIRQTDQEGKERAFMDDLSYATRLSAKPFRFSDRSLRLALQSTAGASSNLFLLVLLNACKTHIFAKNK
ncbi:hypothetical protein [Rossellomorea sp. NS-SX7]|uniref:hypothetical protein n=1 Tax=Rossellomorea sp. NS-SX7 TaxID=3463856 RepID=UPI00405958A2